QGMSTTECNQGYGPVADPRKTDKPMASASQRARPIDRRGAPTRDTMAIRLAPTAIEIAARVLPSASPSTNTPTSGSAVMAPVTGVTSLRSTLSELGTTHRSLTIGNLTPRSRYLLNQRGSPHVIGAYVTTSKLVPCERDPFTCNSIV